MLTFPFWYSLQTIPNLLWLTLDISFWSTQQAMADLNSGCAASDGWPRLIAVETHSIDKKNGAIWLRTFLLVYENLNISWTTIIIWNIINMNNMYISHDTLLTRINFTAYWKFLAYLYPEFRRFQGCMAMLATWAWFGVGDRGPQTWIKWVIEWFSKSCWGFGTWFMTTCFDWVF